MAGSYLDGRVRWYRPRSLAWAGGICFLGLLVFALMAGVVGVLLLAIKAPPGALHRNPTEYATLLIAMAVAFIVAAVAVLVSCVRSGIAVGAEGVIARRPFRPARRWRWEQVAEFEPLWDICLGGVLVISENGQRMNVPFPGWRKAKVEALVRTLEYDRRQFGSSLGPR